MENRARSGGMDRDAAQSVGIEALAFLAGEPELMTRFLQMSGFAVDDLRAAARHPSFFGSLLDFILADERTLLSFAAHAGHDPARVGLARRALGGAPS